MLNLTFGEQVKIILSRKGMTIKELAEMIEEKTGKKMSRQNLTQRLGRDNFQEQDMRMIAEILECPFQLSILADYESALRASALETVEPTQKELSKLARAKERKEKRAKESEKNRLAEAMEQVPSEMTSEPSEKEMTLGDYIAIDEQLKKQETGQIPNIAAQEAVREESVTAAPAQEDTYAQPEETAYAQEAAYAQPEETAYAQEEAYTQPEETAYAQEEAYVQPEETAYAQEDTYAQPEEAQDVSEVLRELEELEHTPQKAEPRQHREEKKASGWRGMFQRRNKREEQERQRREQERLEQERLEEERARQRLEEEYAKYEEPSYEEQPVQEETPVAYEPTYAQTEYRQPVYEEPVYEEDDVEDLTKGELNPYTNHEYESNSVRMHPKRIGYVQVYDRRNHGWTDMTEWAFLGYQERKKAILGKDYEPPIYLD